MGTAEILLIVTGATTSLLSIIGAIFAGMAMLKSTENGKTIAKVETSVNSATTLMKAEAVAANARIAQLERLLSKEETKAAILADAKTTSDALHSAGLPSSQIPIPVTVENPHPVPVRLADHKS